MSNARYFADGVDFYRVAYSDGHPDGPYASFLSANLQLKRETKVRQRETYWRSGVYVDYQRRESGKVQKLVPQITSVENEHGEFEEEMFLMWVDVES